MRSPVELVFQQNYWNGLDSHLLLLQGSSNGCVRSENLMSVFVTTGIYPWKVNFSMIPDFQSYQSSTAQKTHIYPEHRSVRPLANGKAVVFCCHVFLSSHSWLTASLWMSDLQNISPLTVLLRSCKLKPMVSFRESIHLVFWPSSSPAAFNLSKHMP